ncbi:hypothetical protein ACN47E_003681 [Coniothyrium glycines]
MSTTPPSIPTLATTAAYLQAIAHPGVTVLEATAPWCTKCQQIAAHVAELAAAYPSVRFYAYDVQQSEDIAQELGVAQVPTFSVFKDGDIQTGVSGTVLGKVRKAIEECL